MLLKAFLLEVPDRKMPSSVLAFEVMLSRTLRFESNRLTPSSAADVADEL